MTMIEMAMPTMGMGTSSGGACDFSCSLSLGVAARFGDTEQVLRSQARDLATAKSEIEGNPIDPYRLLVKEVPYRDKVTGEIVTEKTFVDGIFEEPISVWTDAGEHGTGTKEEYQEILGRARELAAIKEKATMFWVSPGKDREDGKPEHRAYLWRKDEQGNVAAYAYQLTGSNGSLSRMLNLLSSFGRKKAETIDGNTLLWRDTKEGASHERVFSAFADSLTPKEREQKYGFLQRFENEARKPESVLWGRIESYKNQYQERLYSAYEGDIQAALEKVAPGLIVLAFTRTEEAISQITVEEEVKPLVVEQISVKEIVESIQSKQLILILSPLVPAYLGFLHDTSLHDTPRREGEIGKKETQTVEDRDKKTDKKRIEVRSVARFAQQVITPIIPGLIEMVANIAMLPEDTLDTTSSPEFMTEVHLSHKFRAILSNSPSSPPAGGGHLEGVAERLLPGEVDRDDETLHSYCETCEDLESIDNFHKLGENDYSNLLKLVTTFALYLPVIPAEFVLDSDRGAGIYTNNYLYGSRIKCGMTKDINAKLEVDKKFITDLRKMLTAIADARQVVVIRSEEEKEVTRIGEELVSLAQAILTVAHDNGEINTRLSILLSIYSQEDNSPSVKFLLTALIYHEIKNISTNQQLLGQCSQLNIFIKRIDNLVKETFLLEEIFTEWIDKLSQLVHSYSFERLPISGRMNVPRFQYYQKPTKQFPHFGIIYHSCNFVQ